MSANLPTPAEWRLPAPPADLRAKLAVAIAAELGPAAHFPGFTQGCRVLVEALIPIIEADRRRAVADAVSDALDKASLSVSDILGRPLATVAGALIRTSAGEREVPTC